MNFTNKRIDALQDELNISTAELAKMARVDYTELTAVLSGVEITNEMNDRLNEVLMFMDYFEGYPVAEAIELGIPALLDGLKPRTIELIQDYYESRNE